MKQVDDQDLKFFTGQALAGLLANPYMTSPEAQKYRNMKKITLEQIAVESALGVMEALEVVRAAITQSINEEINKKLDEQKLAIVAEGKNSGETGQTVTSDTP